MPNKFNPKLLYEKDSRRISAVLSELLPEIEQLIRDGFSYQQIVNALQQQEIVNVSVPTFRTTIFRLRKKGLSTKSSLATDAAINTEKKGVTLPNDVQTRSSTILSTQEIMAQNDVSRKEATLLYAEQFQSGITPRIQALMKQIKQ